MEHPPARPALPRTVWILGVVSLLMDLSSEIYHALLPAFLTVTLGLPVAAMGALDGFAEASANIAKLASGRLSDRSRKRKPWILLGYGMAALSKPLFPLAAGVVPVLGARFVDRIGKGIRGAPRDALIGDLAPAEIRGACFGLRQSMDTVGAVLGPLIAVALLWGFATSLHTVLWIAVVPGIVAVLLLLKVPEPADSVRKTARLPLSREGLSRLGSGFWRLSMLGVLIALARFSEAFLVLRASERHVPLKFIPLVLVVMSVVYTLTAYPVGRLSDRVSRTTLLALGMLALVGADAALALANGHALLFLGIALWGLHMGMTQGLLATLIADVSPVAYRGTAFGVFNLMSGAGLLAASALAGWLWDRHGPAATFWAGAALALFAAVWTLLARNALMPVTPDG